LEKVASFSVPWRLPKPPRQSVVHDDVRSLFGHRKAADSSRATLGPHRPTVGSRPRTLSAEERIIAMRRRDIVADRYDDPNIGTPADGRLRVNGIINAATGWKANWGLG